MRQFTAQSWVVLIVYLLALFVSMAIGACLAYLTKSPIPLAFPEPILLALRPIVATVFQISRPDDPTQPKDTQP